MGDKLQKSSSRRDAESPSRTGIARETHALPRTEKFRLAAETDTLAACAPRMKTNFRNLGHFRKLFRILVEFVLVPVQEVAERRARPFVARETVPFLVSGELGEESWNVLKQFVTLRRRERADGLLNFLRGAHARTVTAYVMVGNLW